jgi:hypothetical protein
MPPLPPNITKAGILRSQRGWATSRQSLINNNIRGIGRARMPHGIGSVTGGMLNPPLPPSATRLAMPKGAMSGWAPVSVGGGSSGGGGGAPAALTAMINKGWSNTGGASGCVATNTGAPISFNGKFWVWLYEPANPTELFNAFSYDGTTWEWYSFTSGTSPALSDLTGTAPLATSNSTGNTIRFSVGPAAVDFTINGLGCTFGGSGTTPWPVPT